MSKVHVATFQFFVRLRSIFVKHGIIVTKNKNIYKQKKKNKEKEKNKTAKQKQIQKYPPKKSQ